MQVLDVVAQAIFAAHPSLKIAPSLEHGKANRREYADGAPVRLSRFVCLNPPALVSVVGAPSTRAVAPLRPYPRKPFRQLTPLPLFASSPCPVSVLSGPGSVAWAPCHVVSGPGSESMAWAPCRTTQEHFFSAARPQQPEAHYGPVSPPERGRTEKAGSRPSARASFLLSRNPAHLGNYSHGVQVLSTVLGITAQALLFGNFQERP